MPSVEEKSLALAELMGWKTKPFNGIYHVFNFKALMPYSSTILGRGQFASILLAFPEVMSIFHECVVSGSNIVDGVHVEMDAEYWIPCEPTQANILDEILRMNGKM